MEPDPFDAVIEHAERAWKAECEVAAGLVEKTKFLYTIVAALFGLGLFKIEFSVNPQLVPAMHVWWAVVTVKGGILASVTCFLIAFYFLIRATPSSRQRHAWQGRFQPLFTALGEIVGMIFTYVLLVLGLVMLAIKLFIEASNQTWEGWWTYWIGPILMAVGGLNLLWLGRPRLANPGPVEAYATASELLPLEPGVEDSVACPNPVKKLAYTNLYNATTILNGRNILKRRHVKVAQQAIIFGVFFAGLAVVIYQCAS